MKYVLKFKIQLAAVLLLLSLGLVALSASHENWWFVVLAVGCGWFALKFAFHAGEKKGRGRIVSESDIPLAIYQVVKIVQFPDDAIAILCSNDGRKIVCGSDMDDGRFKNYIVQKIERGEVLVPRFWFNGSKAPINVATPAD